MTEGECYGLIHRDLGADTSLLVRLRMLDRLDMDRFHELCEAVRALRVLWHGREAVPKAVAGRLVEARTEIWLQGDWYKGNERDRIMRAADELGRLAEAVLLDTQGANLNEPWATALEHYLGASGPNSFTGDLASGRGMVKALYDDACRALCDLAERWARQPDVSRRTLGAMQDVLPRADRELWRYPPAKRTELFAAAMKLSDLIANVIYAD